MSAAREALSSTAAAATATITTVSSGFSQLVTSTPSSSASSSTSPPTGTPMLVASATPSPSATPTGSATNASSSSPSSSSSSGAAASSGSCTTTTTTSAAASCSSTTATSAPPSSASSVAGIAADSATIKAQANLFNQGFSSFMSSGDFSDLTICLGDRRFPVHQIILAYSSKFFRRILRQLNEAAQVEAVKLPPTETTSSSTKEDHSHRHRKHSRTSSASSVLTDSNSATSNKRPSTTPPVVTLELPASATIVDFELMLKFIYDGDVTVTEVNAIPFMKMANYFEVKALKKLAGEYLARHITRENALSMLQRAVEFGAEEVQTKCLGTISKHFSQLIEDEGVDPFLSLPWNIMIALLSQDNLITTSEHLVYATACQYVESNSSKLTSVQVDNLFETVRFPLMTVEQLEEATLNALVPRYLLTEAMLHKLKRHENAGAPATPTTDKKPAAPTGKDVLTKETVKDTAKEAEEKKKAAMLKRQTPRAAFAISLEYTHDFDENGLFYCIEEWTNPAHRGRVRIACSSQEKGDVFDILDRNPREFWTADVPASWVCINLGSGRSFVPNYYTLRHGCNSKADCLRNWLLQGSNDGHNWTVILRHTDDTSLTSNFATASWPITNCTQSYRYFRILQTGHNSANHNFLAISGIEIYGDLYEAKKTTSS